jgi:hypothetical protein
MGLLAAMPPDGVHTMARGSLAAGGEPRLADLVDQLARRSGVDLPVGGAVLDFGSSSGRVLRVIAAARPDLRRLGCDPNADAMARAQAHVPGEYRCGRRTSRG